ALRLSYLHHGGNNPDILAKLIHLQAEATALEKGAAGTGRARRAGPAEPPGGPRACAHSLDVALLAIELENRRLEDELLALKVRRERRTNPGSSVAQWHSEELAQLQAEVKMLRSHMERRGQWLLPPAILPPPVAPP
ncbi:CCD17 protein, partial [Turnix velox]|nr:CCD17 protein [Turnix velox]